MTPAVTQRHTPNMVSGVISVTYDNSKIVDFLTDTDNREILSNDSLPEFRPYKLLKYFGILEGNGKKSFHVAIRILGAKDDVLLMVSISCGHEPKDKLKFMSAVTECIEIEPEIAAKIAVMLCDFIP